MKKIMLLPTMAMAAVAFAVPAVAQAEPDAHFLHEGSAIEETKTTHLTGNIGFSTANGSFDCGVHPTASIGTTSGTITDLGITTDECNAEGALAECELVEDSLTSGEGVNTLTPAPNQNAIIIKNLKLTKVFVGENCPVANLPLELAANEIKLEVDNNAAISEVTSISGSGVLAIEPSTPIAATTPFTTEGFEAVEAGTIGIGFPTG